MFRGPSAAGRCTYRYTSVHQKSSHTRGDSRVPIVVSTPSVRTNLSQLLNNQPLLSSPSRLAASERHAEPEAAVETGPVPPTADACDTAVDTSKAFDLRYHQRVGQVFLRQHGEMQRRRYLQLLHRPLNMVKLRLV